MTDDRYARGRVLMKKVLGDKGTRTVDQLGELSPDLAHYYEGLAYGDIYSRPGLDLKSREIAGIAALTALGNAEPQLKAHVRGALNVGCTREEIEEVIIQMIAYAGFPAAINGMLAAHEIFSEDE